MNPFVPDNGAERQGQRERGDQIVTGAHKSAAVAAWPVVLS